MTIIHPIHIYAKDRNGAYVVQEYQWTDDLSLAQNRSLNYVYRRAVLLHEFGHTAGLGHGYSPDDVMESPNRAEPQLTDNDKSAMRANYAGHSPH